MHSKSLALDLKRQVRRHRVMIGSGAGRYPAAQRAEMLRDQNVIQRHPHHVERRVRGKLPETVARIQQFPFPQ